MDVQNLILRPMIAGMEAWQVSGHLGDPPFVVASSLQPFVRRRRPSPARQR